MRGIYLADAGSLWLRAVNLAYGAVLVPPGNRFIAPLAVGAALIALFQGRRHDVTKPSLCVTAPR